MSEAEFGTTKEGMFLAESLNQSSSPSKPPCGTSEWRRLRPKWTRKVSIDNDSSSDVLHVSNRKRAEKFNYLSNSTQSKNAEVNPAKPIASQETRWNEKGQGKSSPNHMTFSVNSVDESSSHVSRSGGRIKPNNHWTPEADFDPGPTKMLPSRVNPSKNAVKSVEIIPEEKSLPDQPLQTAESDDKENDVEEDNPSACPQSYPKTSEPKQQICIIEKEVREEVEIESSFITAEVDEMRNTATPVVIGDQEFTIGADVVVVSSSEIMVSSTTSKLFEGEFSPNEANGDCSPIEDDSIQNEFSSSFKCSSYVNTSDSTGSERENSSLQNLSSKDNVTEELYYSSAGNTPKADDDEVFDTQSVLISPKTFKVKSKWQRTSELQQEVICSGFSDQSSCNDSPLSMSPKTSCTLPHPFVDQRDNHTEGKNRMTGAIIEERLKNFEIVEENQYLTSRNISKEVKRMSCDCTLSKEEIAQGELGCGENCINRLLMIECGPRCQLGSRCTNKRFQKRQYGKIEVFNTEKKGMGLRALQNMEPGDFIIEYVGDVIDQREFRRRAKEYASEKNEHYYFMALKSDAIIDATRQGNISRFINHSCNPNAETQKWTVNGDLRIGFFARKRLKAGDEITIDYQFQRYGKEAQRCFCESFNCRGWIGEDPGKEDKNRDKREKQKNRTLIRDEVNNIDLERKIEKLVTSGVKNRKQTLDLSRLMVRAEEFEARRNILTLLRNSEQSCRRLFLDYHGLKLLWGWMVDVSSAGNSSENVQFKIDLLSTLSSLPVPNKTMLLDSKLISIVEKWTNIGDSIKTEEGLNKTEQDSVQVIHLATQLLESWSNLKEVFRIPKKERIEKMKEHEREADQEDTGGRFAQQEEPSNKKNSYNRRPNNYHLTDSSYRDVKERENLKRMHESPDLENRKIQRIELDNLSKEERRKQFALQVAQQDEELRARRSQEGVWGVLNGEHKLSYGVEPMMTPLNLKPTSSIVANSPGFTIELPAVCLRSRSANLSALTSLSESNSTNLLKQVPHVPPLLYLVIPKGYNPTIMGPLIMNFELCKHEASETPFVPASLVSPLTETQLSSKLLPPFWRQAADGRGRPYYYHVRQRLPQWERPTPHGVLGFSTEEEKDENEATTNISEPTVSPIIENFKEQEKQRRRSLLCREKIISPRSELERSDLAQSFRELKERVLQQKLIRIRERGLMIEETKPEEKTKRRKLNEKEKGKMKKTAKEKYKRSLQKGKSRKKIKVVKEMSETIGEGKKGGEGSDGVGRYVMDGSLDDYMHVEYGGDDEAGEQERNRDVSANTVRKIKDAFRMKISSDIVNILSPYRRPDCKLGRITCKEDFKHLARKMTHFVLAKELKDCRNIEDLVVNDDVKHKAKKFITKYMVKFGPAYQRGNDEDA